ncbi:hypothetical protein ASPCADRAFT_507815 [Aspergillus carbonarius ITEM 5010]|uniref:Heterokaryon incompatibility domain-containing protein n=1 Tax=Aspergillus carbonarius (strain ITEM 5010) TaxID=602072 RepID=A0A1R3RKE7_ASPC5|nr:hypothetical protein ASPCADRAFT_507815 [Aspergillus carbonarius ITEM 5010]
MGCSLGECLLFWRPTSLYLVVGQDDWDRREAPLAFCSSPTSSSLQYLAGVLSPQNILQKMLTLKKWGKKWECSVCNVSGEGWVNSRDSLRISALRCNTCHLIMAAANLVIDTHARKRNIAKKFVYRTIGPYLQLNIWGVGEPRLVTVDIFEPKETRFPWAPQGRGSDLTDIFIIDDAVIHIRHWLKTCMEEHKQCSMNPKTSLPRRVIDIGCSDADKVSLYQPKLADAWSPYVAVSYCWGTEGNLMTTKENIDIHRQHIEWKLIPCTLQEAISLTRRLGIRYIWIDALCIIQNDGEDWNREAVKMGDYYQSAQLVVAAARSPNAKSGLFGPRLRVPYSYEGGHMPTTFTSKELNVSTWLGRPKYQVYVREALHEYGGWYTELDDPRANPLSSRGWALQERLLSTRIVHLAAPEMVWECKEAGWCECDKGLPTSRLATAEKDIHIPQVEWTATVEEYSRRSFTCLQDKLVALDGIAQRYRGPDSAQYLFGLWERYLADQLGWSAQYGGNWSLPLTANKDIILCPSWSWISTYYPVEFRTYRKDPPEPIEFEKLPNLPAEPGYRDMIIYPACSKDLWGLTLVTRVFQARVVTIDTWGDNKATLALQTHEGSGFATYTSDVPLSPAGPLSDWAMTKWKRVDEGDCLEFAALGMLSFGDHSVLVLKPSIDHPDCYLRVGIAEHEGDYNFGHSAQRTSVTII